MVRSFLLIVFSMCAHHFPLCRALEKVEIPPQGITPNTNQADNDDRMEHTQQQHRELIEWIRSHPGGFVNDKLEVRQADIKNPSLGSGMFVNGAIKKGELLYSVPWDLIIKPDGYGHDKRNGAYNAPLLSCEAVYSLIHELNLGEKSKFGPYLKYFHDFKTNYLFEQWSAAGTDLINYIAGYDMNADGTWLEHWYKVCDGSDVILHEKAALYVSTRAEDHLLIPLFDLANHRNGHMNHAYINKKIKIVGGISADGIATRDIGAGEEIVHSYNMNAELLARKYYGSGSSIDEGSGTTNVFYNFGFVEPMPQRWIFKNYLEDDKLVIFDLDYAKSDTGQEGELEVRWRDD
eukprot:scaffold152245_cov40-Attheya_sp.AAC.1